MNIDQYIVSDKIPENLPKMRELYLDLFSGGKCYRGFLVSSVAGEMKIDEQDSDVLARCIEFIHNSSLLHDDIVDDAVLRRGKTTAWKKYGSGYAILSGDYLLARVIKDLCKLKNLELVEYTSESILSLVEGEWLQDACHGRIDVSLEEMQKVHKHKTSALFSWCFKAPALLSGKFSNEEVAGLASLGEILGELLQRSDDLLDFNIRNNENKTYFKDVPAGYFNLFMIQLTRGLSDLNKKKVFSYTDLDSFLKDFDIDLEANLRAFDQDSQRLIDQVFARLDSFEFFSDEFKKDMKKATHKIYWRD